MCGRLSSDEYVICYSAGMTDVYYCEDGGGDAGEVIASDVGKSDGSAANDDEGYVAGCAGGEGSSSVAYDAAYAACAVAAGCDEGKVVSGENGWDDMG